MVFPSKPAILCDVRHCFLSLASVVLIEEVADGQLLCQSKLPH